MRSLGRQRRRHRREQAASALSLPSSTNLSAAATLLPVHPYVLALLRFLRPPLGDALGGTSEAGGFVLGPTKKAESMALPLKKVRVLYSALVMQCGNGHIRRPRWWEKAPMNNE